MERDWNEIAERLQAEQIMPVSRAARLVPTDRGRRGYCSANALVSWILRGKRGIFLDGIRGPGKSWWTSKEALARFLAALSAASVGRPIPIQTARLDRERLRRARAAMEELAAL